MNTHGVPAGWAAAIAAYLTHLTAMGLLPSTIYTRRQQLERVARCLGVADPWAVTGPELLTWFAEQTIASETRRGRRAALRSFYRWAVEDGRMPGRSPAAMLPRVRPSPPNPMPAPDSVYLPAYAEADERVRLMMLLAADHGMRRMEVAVVHPGQDLVEDLDGWSLHVHGKGQRDRVVPLTADVARRLRSLPAGYAFPGQIDGHLSPRWVGKLVNRLMPGAWTIHKLRHRAGTAWHEVSGGDVFAVQELLGHADPKTTRVYVKIRSERLREIVNAAA